MSRLTGLLCLLLASAGIVSVSAGSQADNAILETWDAAFLEGARAGHVHTTAVESVKGGNKIVRTIVDMQLRVKRFKQVLEIRAETGDDALPDGQVVATFMRQTAGRAKAVLIVGVVNGKQLELILDGKPGTMHPAPWDERVLGLYRLQSLWLQKKVRPGDTFSYLAFEPTVNLVTRMDVAVKELEEVEVPGKGKARLLRVETVPEKLEGIQLPKVTTWLDSELRVVRQDTEIPGLGQLTLVRTSREAALSPSGDSAPADIGIGQLIRLNKKIAKPHETTDVVFRISVKGDGEAATAFALDDRQKVISAAGASFDFQVQACHGPQKSQYAPAEPGNEFIDSSFYITSADTKVQELARQAVGNETDPWKKALAIEKWVYRNMRSTNAEALNPADQVARSLEGDCTEYAMLTAAMCRAQRIPSRTAIGLVYQDSKAGPVMAFHMWTEVWVENQWAPIDATLGRGGVGATHLKVTDHSWHETRSQTPLLPLLRILGKTTFQVISSR
jgi:hypothetical protein